MRTKIVHGIDDNVHIDRWLVKNEELPDTDPYKLSEDEFCGRWLALKPNSSSYENFEPCMNCLYYGEFETIDGETTNAFGRWEPPYIECKKLCMNCICYGAGEDAEDSGISEDSSPDSVS